jgi:hypothetical protein
MQSLKCKRKTTKSSTSTELSTTVSALISSVASLSTIDNEDNLAGNQLGGKASAFSKQIGIVNTRNTC